MKRINRITALFFALVMITALAACSPKNPLSGKWKHGLEYKKIVENIVKTSLDTVDQNQREMYEELYKAFDGCTVDLVMEFRDDNTFDFSADKESALKSIAKIQENMKTAIPNAYKAIGLGDEEFEAYLKAQNKTVDDLVKDFTEDFSVENLTSGVGNSGEYLLEGDKLYLFKDGKKDENSYIVISLDEDKFAITEIVGEVEGFRSVDKLLPMEFTKE